LWTRIVNASRCGENWENKILPEKRIITCKNIELKK
jgi:hypothetical protein